MRVFALVLACMTTPAAASDWAITEIDGAATTGAPEISFADGGISGSTGCNRFTGQASVAAGVLQLPPALAMTRRACLGTEESAQENRLATLLRGDVRMQPDPFDGSLTLVGNGVTARLVPGPAHPAVSSAAYVIVSGVDATLNIRSEATTGSVVLARAPLGIILRNEGCEDGGDRTWCRISFIDASGIEGWAAAEFLSPAFAIRRAEAELFDQIGRVDCGAVDGPTAQCDYGLARENDGSGAMLIYLADNRRLLLEFRGTSVMAAADDDAGKIVIEPGDADVVVTSGTDRLTLPMTVLLGE